MRVRDVMTQDVIAIGPGESVHKAAQLMADHRVSGLPVIDDGGHLVGIVSEGDLILQQSERSLPWWRRFLDDPEVLAREYQKAAGTTVREVMTEPVVSVSPDLAVASAARILHERGFRRLPVVEDGRLVGIVSRGDLVKVMATTPPASMSQPDQQLVAAMRRRMAAEPWPSSGLVVEAHDGVLRLWGLVQGDSERAALETMARGTPGCRGVDNRLVVRRHMPYHYGM